MKAIDASKKLRLDKFQTQVEEYQGLLENNGLVGYAQEVLKETDQSCFVQTAKQLHLRCVALNLDLLGSIFQLELRVAPGAVSCARHGHTPHLKVDGSIFFFFNHMADM